MADRTVEYWSLWGHGKVCTMHRTQRNAVREALRCERSGGEPHEIVKVVKLGSASSLKRRGRP